MVENTEMVDPKLPQRVVIDASTAVAWLIDDEKSQPIDHFIEQCTFQNISLVAPSLLTYEVANSIKSAVISKRISQDRAITQIRLLAGLHIDTSKHFSPDIIMTIALECAISAYDAAYVALAKELSAPLYTLDEKLHKKVKNYVKCVVIQ